MIVDRSFIEAGLWLALIISSPGIFILTRAVVAHLIYKYWPINTVIVTHRSNSGVVTYKLGATGYLIDQLESLEAEAKNGQR